MKALLVFLYPASWRRRYGDEFAAVLDATRLTPHALVDVACAALALRAKALVRLGSLTFGHRRSGSSRAIVPLVGLIMLMPSVAALITIALRFTLGIGGPFELLWLSTPLLTRYVVLLLPVLSFVAVASSLVSLAINIRAGNASVVLAAHLDRAALTVGFLSATVLAALLRYYLLRSLLTWQP